MRETVILSEAKNLGTQEGMRPFALLRVTIMLTVFSLLLTGCGYEFGTTVKPGSARGLQLAVPVFHNDTFEPILDKRVTEFVRRQFLQADGLTLVNEARSAPLVLSGRIRSYSLQILSFRQAQTNEQRVTLVVAVSLRDSPAEKVP